MDARVPQVAQSLFVRTGPDGHTWEFTSLADGGCALLRDGQVVAAGDGSEGSVAFLLQAFLGASAARTEAAMNAASSDDSATPDSGTGHRAA
jgi:hypothetical protein